jgi:hypothetical protein
MSEMASPHEILNRALADITARPNPLGHPTRSQMFEAYVRIAAAQEIRAGLETLAQAIQKKLF